MKRSNLVIPALIASAALLYWGASRSYRASATTYYNTALAQQEAGDLGAAILNYERAAIIDPGAGDIAANLERARKDAASISPEPAGWQAYALRISPNTWGSFAALALLLLAALGFANLPKMLARGAAALALATVILSGAALVTWQRANAGRSIVLKPGTALRVSPFEDASALATLPPGKTVRVLPGRTHADFVLAHLETGQSGWLKSREFATVTEP